MYNASMASIAIIEDDVALREELSHLLELQGYEVLGITDFEGASGKILEAAPDCVLLDLSLPRSDGHSICRDIREKSSIPVIMLTSSVNEFDEVMALGLGANDYITKPYRPAVLLARIRTALRSASSVGASPIAYGGVVLDCNRALATYEDRSCELTKNEMRILSKLLTAKGGIVTRQDLMYELWESDEFVDDNTLTVNVNRLRKSLEGIGLPADFIKTHRGIGYSV